MRAALVFNKNIAVEKIRTQTTPLSEKEHRCSRRRTPLLLKHEYHLFLTPILLNTSTSAIFLKHEYISS